MHLQQRVRPHPSPRRVSHPLPRVLSAPLTTFVSCTTPYAYFLRRIARYCNGRTHNPTAHVDMRTLNAYPCNVRSLRFIALCATPLFLATHDTPKLISQPSTKHLVLSSIGSQSLSVERLTGLKCFQSIRNAGDPYNTGPFKSRLVLLPAQPTKPLNQETQGKHAQITHSSTAYTRKPNLLTDTTTPNTIVNVLAAAGQLSHFHPKQPCGQHRLPHFARHPSPDRQTHPPRLACIIPLERCCLQQSLLHLVMTDSARKTHVEPPNQPTIQTSGKFTAKAFPPLLPVPVASCRQLALLGICLESLFVERRRRLKCF